MQVNKVVIKLIDLTGQRFGKWTVLERVSNSAGRQAKWHCKCDCGHQAIVLGYTLRYGSSHGCRFCGRKGRKPGFKHGLYGTKLYIVWKNMIDRCENRNNIFYKYYGARGIKVCPEWRKDVVAFYNWAISNGYKEGLSIDRIDNNGNYEPWNCRFVTRKTQCRNYRRNRRLKIGNKTKLVCEWAEQAGIKTDVLNSRIKRGVSEDRLLEPVHK